MDNQKALQFNGTAGGYFGVFVVTAVSWIIPIFGTAFAFNYASNWVIENLKVGGKDVQYKAGYGETLKFVFINLLLVCITFGIYSFWFVPKSYRYIVDHTGFVGSTPSAAAAPATPPQVPPAATPPSSSTPPPANLVQ